MAPQETYRYRLPVDLANKIRTLSRTSGMESVELSQRLVAIALMVDKNETEGGSTILRRLDQPEEALGVIRRRSLFRRVLDRIEIEAAKEQSVFAVNIPSNLMEDVKKISKREKLPLNRALEEMFTQAMYIATTQIEPNTQIVFKQANSSEVPMPIALPH